MQWGGGGRVKTSEIVSMLPVFKSISRCGSGTIYQVTCPIKYLNFRSEKEPPKFIRLTVPITKYYETSEAQSAV